MKTPTTLIIMDGFGLRGSDTAGNAIASRQDAHIWTSSLRRTPSCQLSASGLDVGLPDGQMGNSEVGHTNIGAGRVVFQDLPQITKAIDDGDFFQNPAYVERHGQLPQNRRYGPPPDGPAVRRRRPLSHRATCTRLLKMAKQHGL